MSRDLAVVAAAAALLAAGCGGGGARAKVEKLLGEPLPASVGDVHYFRWRPSDQISFYTAYVKLGGPRADLLALVRRLGLHRRGEAGALPYLPAAWSTVPQVELDWWDASAATPRDSWASRFGVDGTLLAKLERGHLYLIATDTGLREETTATTGD